MIDMSDNFNPELATAKEMRDILYRISKVLDVWEIESKDPDNMVETMWGIAVGDCLNEINEAISDTGRYR